MKKLMFTVLVLMLLGCTKESDSTDWRLETQTEFGWIYLTVDSLKMFTVSDTSILISQFMGDTINIVAVTKVGMSYQITRNYELIYSRFIEGSNNDTIQFITY